MKANLRFFFTVVLIFCISVLATNTILDREKAEYEGDGVYYVSNNVRGVKEDSSLFLDELGSSTASITANDALNRTYRSRFSDITLVSGRYPSRVGEFVAPGNQDHAGSRGGKTNANAGTKVGEYKETLGVNGLGNIYKMFPGTKLRVSEIVFRKTPGTQQKKLLQDLGFIRINAHNVDRKINADTYKTIALILKIFSAILLLMSVVSWLSLLIKQVNDSAKQLEMLASFGAGVRQIAYAFVYVKRKSLLRVFAESVLGFNLVGAAAAVYFKVFWFAFLNGILLLAWIAVLSSIVAAVMYRTLRKPSQVKSRYARFAVGAAVTIGCAVGLFLMDVRVLLVALAALMVCMLLRSRSTTAKALFSNMGSVSVALFSVLTVLVLVDATVLSIVSTAKEREDLAVQTSIPYNILVTADKLPDNTAKKSDYHRHAYINPVDGVTLNGKQVFPLVYSTDLKLYKPYILGSQGLHEGAVVIGQVLAKRAHADVGSAIAINGRKLTVSHIVNTQQYDGMMIYLSDSLFASTYGSTGNTYYGTDLSEQEVSKYFPSDQFKTHSQFRELYRNSVTEIRTMLYPLGGIVLIVSAFIAYKIFAIFVDFIKWKLNVVRGMGISFAEYAQAVYIQFLSLAAGAFFAVAVMFRPCATVLTNAIFDVSESYWPIQYRPAYLWMTVIEFVMLIGIVAVASYRRFNKGSVYEQYLSTATKE